MVVMLKEDRDFKPHLPILENMQTHGVLMCADAFLVVSLPTSRLINVDFTTDVMVCVDAHA